MKTNSYIPLTLLLCLVLGFTFATCHYWKPEPKKILSSDPFREETDRETLKKYEDLVLAVFNNRYSHLKKNGWSQCAEFSEATSYKWSKILKMPPIKVLSKNCEGSEVIFIKADGTLASENDERLEIAGEYTGSAGATMFIATLPESNSNCPRVLFEANIIAVDKIADSDKIGCPKMIVMLHGSYFERPGNEYGFSQLEYSPKEKRYILGRTELSQDEIKKLQNK